MVVVAELDSRLAAGFAGFVEEFGGLFISISRLPLRFVNPGADDIFVAENAARFDGLWPLVLDDGIRHVTRRRRQAVFVENCAKVFRGIVEVAGELDFFVADGGDFGERTGDIGLHKGAHGVEFHANGIQLVRGGETAEGK